MARLFANLLFVCWLIFANMSFSNSAALILLALLVANGTAYGDRFYYEICGSDYGEVIEAKLNCNSNLVLGGCGLKRGSNFTMTLKFSSSKFPY